VGWFLFEMGVICLGKGSKPRPCATTREEYNLRCKYAVGEMPFAEFERRYKELLKAGKIKRNGRIINES